MNETIGQKATVATIAGVKETLVFGSRYNVRDAGDNVLRGVLLSERFPNGDLAFVEDPTELYPDGRTFRVRPSRIDVIVPAGETTKPEGVVSTRRDDETARAYLRRLERGLGAGSYARWIETDAGQKALADAAREDQAARNGKVRRKADPTKVVDVLWTIYPGVVATSRTTSLDDLPAVEEALARGVRLAEELASEPEFRDREDRADAIAAEVARQIPELATSGGAPSGFSPAEELAVAATEGVPVRVEITPRGRKLIERQAEEARSKGRPYAERNQVWRCGTCKRRTRAPFCANGHDQVDAPAGKRREDRGAK